MRLGILVVSFFCMACVAVPKPLINTETKQGEALQGYEVQKTGSRKFVPVGEKARNVVAQSTFSHRGSISIVSITRSFWPWGEVVVYTNCLKCHKEEPMHFEQPKNPWWLWPAIVGSVIVLLLTGYYLKPLLEFISVPISWLRRK